VAEFGEGNLALSWKRIPPFKNIPEIILAQVNSPVLEGNTATESQPVDPGF
jgi:hypothetical protein